MTDSDWIDAGPLHEFPDGVVRELVVGREKFAISRRGDEFGVISGSCNHVGGPLGRGTLEGDFVVCPWHYWKFHWRTGVGEPGYEEDRVPSHDTRVVDGRLEFARRASNGRTRKPHPPHPLARSPQRSDGPVRVLGISTTVMTPGKPRYSTSEDLLEHALDHARQTLECDTQLVRVRDLRIRECEGYYSKSARACT